MTSGTASLVDYGNTGFSSADASLQSTSWTMINGFATVRVNVSSDTVIDPGEQFQIRLAYTANSQSFVKLSHVITIVDTNTPTYSVTANQLQVTEGGTATFTVSTTNVNSGVVLNWSAAYGTASPSDISPTSGTVTINNSSGTISVQAVADSLTESAETFRVLLYRAGTLVATSGDVSIVDPGGGSCNDQCTWRFVVYPSGDTEWVPTAQPCSTCDGNSSECCCDVPPITGNETDGDTATTNCGNPLP